MPLHKLPKLRTRVGFLVAGGLIPVSVVILCQQPVAQIRVVDTCTCKASVAVCSPFFDLIYLPDLFCASADAGSPLFGH